MGNNEDAARRLEKAVSTVVNAGLTVKMTVIEVYYESKDGVRARLKETYDENFAKVGNELAVDLAAEGGE